MVWQDGDTCCTCTAGRQGGLSAVHQLGWEQDPKAPCMFAMPVWD